VNELVDRLPNPFSTRHVRPGAIPFHFPPGINAAALVARLREFNWRGAIVGPHGSGKSTLLAAMLPELERAGRRAVSVSLHDGERRLPPEFAAAIESGDENTLAIVDGYEQLSRWSRRRLDRLCANRGGLLVTSHEPVGFPLLLRTAVDLNIAQQIVGELLTCEQTQSVIGADDVRRAFAAHQGNLRETLFSLYDLFERRSRGEITRQV